MEPAFWDTSALVPLFLRVRASPRVHQLAHRYSPVVWWGTLVEAQSAFARELRTGSLTAKEYTGVQQDLRSWQGRWQEVRPSDSLRALAEELLGNYPLSAADALQLAAAYTWTDQRAFGRSFITGDKRLLAAARALGFRAVPID